MCSMLYYATQEVVAFSHVSALYIYIYIYIITKTNPFCIKCSEINRNHNPSFHQKGFAILRLSMPSQV